MFRACHTISPLRRSCNLDAWHDVLLKGAQHPANLSTAGSIYLSTDTLVAPRSLVHLSAPDRYFGLPLADLTDGQLMAYEAAKAVFDK